MSLFLLDRDSCSHCLVGAGAGVLPCRLPCDTRLAEYSWQTISQTRSPGADQRRPNTTLRHTRLISTSSKQTNERTVSLSRRFSRPYTNGRAYAI